MMIGKRGRAVTSISTADADSLTVRERDLCGDLMGRVSFTEYFYLLVTGREPTVEQRYFLDLLLVAIAEHGLVPTNVAARMTLAADPGSLQGAVAAGILGCGSVILGASQYCGEFLVAALAAPDLRTFVQGIKDQGGKVPGFGHPLHKAADPRSTRINQLLAERGAGGKHVALANATVPVVAQVWGKLLPMNVSMMIAAVLLDLEFPPAMLKAIPILARTGGLLAHLAEELETPIGFMMANAAEEAIAYEA